MARMNFGRGETDTADPTALVIRSTENGSLDVSMVAGDDPDVTAATRLIAAVLAGAGAEALVGLIRDGAEDTDIDVDALLARLSADASDDS